VAKSKNKSQPEIVVIKKYANRRLYNTSKSCYVTLENLAEMVRNGEDFVVNDAKSGDDITRSVLAQIIFEEEANHEKSRGNPGESEGVVRRKSSNFEF